MSKLNAPVASAYDVYVLLLIEGQHRASVSSLVPRPSGFTIAQSVDGLTTVGVYPASMNDHQKRTLLQAYQKTLEGNGGIATSIDYETFTLTCGFYETQDRQEPDPSKEEEVLSLFSVQRRERQVTTPAAPKPQVASKPQQVSQPRKEGAHYVRLIRTDWRGQEVQVLDDLGLKYQVRLNSGKEVGVMKTSCEEL